MTEHQLSPEAWVDQYGDALYKYAYFRVNNATVAEELVSETFVAGVSSKKNFRADSAEKTWLIGILKHKILDHFRKKNRERPLSEMESNDEDKAFDSMFDERGHVNFTPNEWGKDPQAALENKEFWQVFEACLGGLSEKNHKVYVLKEIEGYSISELCNNLSLSATNISVILHRARLKLKECLEAKWFS